MASHHSSSDQTHSQRPRRPGRPFREASRSASSCPLYAAGCRFRHIRAQGHSGNTGPGERHVSAGEGSRKKTSLLPSTSLTTSRRGATPLASSVNVNPAWRSRLSWDSRSSSARVTTALPGSVRILRHVDRTGRSQPPDTLCLVREHVGLSTQETRVPLIGGGVVGNRQPSEAVRDHHGMILPQPVQGSFRNTGPGQRPLYRNAESAAVTAPPSPRFHQTKTFRYRRCRDRAKRQARPVLGLTWPLASGPS